MEEENKNNCKNDSNDIYYLKREIMMMQEDYLFALCSFITSLLVLVSLIYYDVKPDLANILIYISIYFFGLFSGLFIRILIDKMKKKKIIKRYKNAEIKTDSNNRN